MENEKKFKIKKSTDEIKKQIIKGFCIHELRKNRINKSPYPLFRKVKKLESKTEDLKAEEVIEDSKRDSIICPVVCGERYVPYVDEEEFEEEKVIIELPLKVYRKIDEEKKKLKEEILRKEKEEELERAARNDFFDSYLDKPRKHWCLKSHCEYLYFPCRCRFVNIPSQLGRCLWFEYIALCKPKESYIKEFAEALLKRIFHLRRLNLQMDAMTLLNYTIRLSWLNSDTRTRILRGMETLLRQQQQLEIAGFEHADLEVKEAIGILLNLAMGSGNTIKKLYLFHFFKREHCPLIGCFPTYQEYAPYMKEDKPKGTKKPKDRKIESKSLGEIKNGVTYINLTCPESPRSEKITQRIVKTEEVHETVKSEIDKKYKQDVDETTAKRTCDCKLFFEISPSPPSSVSKTVKKPKTPKNLKKKPDLLEKGVDISVPKESIENVTNLIDYIEDKKSIPSDSGKEISTPKSSSRSSRLVTSNTSTSSAVKTTPILKSSVQQIVSSTGETVTSTTSGKDSKSNVNDQIKSDDLSVEITKKALSDLNGKKVDSRKSTELWVQSLILHGMENKLKGDIQPGVSTPKMSSDISEANLSTDGLIVIKQEPRLGSFGFDSDFIIPDVVNNKESHESRYSSEPAHVVKKTNELINFPVVSSSAADLEVNNYKNVDNLQENNGKKTKKQLKNIDSKTSSSDGMIHKESTVADRVPDNDSEKSGLPSLNSDDILTTGNNLIRLRESIQERIPSEVFAPDDLFYRKRQAIKGKIFKSLHFPLQGDDISNYEDNPIKLLQKCYDHLLKYHYSTISVHTYRMMYRIALAGLTSLNKLCINFSYIADGTGETLLSIGAIREGNLEDLKLLCFRREMPSFNKERWTPEEFHDVPDHAWRQAVILCPSLRVHLVLLCLPRYNTSAKFITKHMPLASVHISTGYRGVKAGAFRLWYFDCTLKILTGYTDTLVSLSFYIWHSRERLDNLIKRILAKLIHLEIFEYYGTLQYTRTMEEICLYFLRNKTKIQCLTIFKIKDSCYGRKTENDIKQLTEKYMPYFQTRRIKFSMGTFCL